MTSLNTRKAGLQSADTDGIKKDAAGVALDACLIAAAQAVEHYTVARSGALRERAKVLGHIEADDLLCRIQDMEKGTNSKLTAMTVSAVDMARKTA